MGKGVGGVKTNKCDGTPVVPAIKASVSTSSRNHNNDNDDDSDDKQLRGSPYGNPGSVNGPRFRAKESGAAANSPVLPPVKRRPERMHT